MRNNFIEELFHGNIAPCNDSISKDKDFKKVWDRLVATEEILEHRLEGDDKKLFNDYVNAYGVAFSMNEASSFIRGFRIGARIIFDTFDDADDLMFV